MLLAHTRLPTRVGADYLPQICANLAEMEFSTRVDGALARIDLRDGLGFADLSASADALLVEAKADTEQGLSILKFLLGLQLEKVAASENPEVVWTGHGCDAEVLPGLREIRVRRIADVTPHIRRITFAGEDLARFDSDALHVRLLFPPAGLEKPEWPKPGKNGRPAWPDEPRRPAARIYTIRRVDVAAGELDIDFVLHDAPGVASDWARFAREGDMIGLLGPGGRETAAADWRLLAGDETAIPAIARILEKLSATARGLALIEVEDEREIQTFAHPAGFEIRWLFRRGVEAGFDAPLRVAVRAVEWPQEDSIFGWIAAEETVARDIRKHWRDERGLTRAQHLAVGYWRRKDSPEDGDA